MSNQPDRVKMYRDYFEPLRERLTTLSDEAVDGAALIEMSNSHALLLAEQAKEIKELKERVEKLEERYMTNAHPHV